MSLREQFDQLDRIAQSAPHRIARCPQCRLILPCRQDGKYGPCDARDLDGDAMENLYKLVRAVFEDGGKIWDKHLAGKRARYARKSTKPVRAYGQTAPSEPGKYCKRGHEQISENRYLSTRNGKPRVWCRPCQLVRYAEKDLKRHDQKGQNQSQRNTGCAGETERVCRTEQGEPGSIHGGIERTGPGREGEAVTAGR